MKIYYLILSFFVYGFLGWCLEVAFAAVKDHKFVNRGFLNGPICPIYGFGVTIVTGILDPLMDNTWLLFLWSAVLTTVLEYFTGLIMEKVFHHRWWNYSKMPLNIGGYVCLPFSLIWGAFCVVIVRNINPFVQKMLSYIPHWLGIVLIVIFSTAFVIDLVVTVSGILKINKRLKAMDDAANELQRIADDIGGTISATVLDGVALTEDAKVKAQEAIETVKQDVQDRKETAGNLLQSKKARIDELKIRYQQLSSQPSYTYTRIIKAFPALRPTQYQEQFGKLKENALAQIKNKKNSSK